MVDITYACIYLQSCVIILLPKLNLNLDLIYENKSEHTHIEEYIASHRLKGNLPFLSSPTYKIPYIIAT